MGNNMSSKERIIWEIVDSILENHGDMVDNISIHESSGSYCEENRKVYCSQGYCFELEKIEADESDTSGVEDGYVYSFNEPWDGFKEAGIDSAIQILSQYGHCNK